MGCAKLFAMLVVSVVELLCVADDDDGGDMDNVDEVADNNGDAVICIAN